MSSNNDLDIKANKFLEENKSWETMYLVYAEFFKTHQAQSISYKYVDGDGNQLGHWFRYQRQRFDSNVLPDEAIYLLNKVNPEWSLKKRKGRSAGDRSIQWDERFNLVKEFIEEYGNPVPARTKYKDQNIGYWVVRQKTSFEKSALDETQTNRLIEIGIIKNDDDEMVWNN